MHNYAGSVGFSGPEVSRILSCTPKQIPIYLSVKYIRFLFA